jgi:hypothetical protein
MSEFSFRLFHVGLVVDTMELGNVFHQGHQFTHTNYYSTNVPYPFTIGAVATDPVQVAGPRDPVSLYS